MDYFIILEDILLTKLPKEKFIKFDKFYKLLLENKLIFDHNYRALEIENPSYTDFLSIVKPIKLPPIKSFVYFNHTASWSMSRKMVKFNFDTFNFKLFIWVY